MSDKTKSFLYLLCFITCTIIYHVLDKSAIIDETPEIAKVEVINHSTIVGIE